MQLSLGERNGCLALLSHGCEFGFASSHVRGCCRPLLLLSEEFLLHLSIIKGEEKVAFRYDRAVLNQKPNDCLALYLTAEFKHLAAFHNALFDDRAIESLCKRCRFSGGESPKLWFG